jgi:BolA family transcriptional regulator, general stress-responsive regulator
MRMDSAVTAKKIEEILRKDFSPSELEVEDQSYMHAGHKAAGGGGHFFVQMRSKRFNGLAPLARQRLVIEAVKEMMDREIHALSMKCIPE